ncbi:MAG: hypothetical protein COA49_05930 [Bacteroidetes bacterium]|nr:MAG: hypothetical protein COA49_05930 [Bacteroidota bacterium]
MTEYNVYILRPASLPQGIVEDAYSIIEHSKNFENGPVKFHLHSWDYEPEAGSLEEVADNEELTVEPLEKMTVYNLLQSASHASLDLSNDDLFRQFRNAEVSPPLPIGKRAVSVNELLAKCKEIASAFRKKNGIYEKNNLVIVTTINGNTNNYFAEGADVNTPTAFVQINHTVMQEGNPQLLLAYYMAAMPLKALGFNDPDYINKYAHFDTKGCMNDLCADNVYHLRIKTKTADICEECKEILTKNEVPFSVIKQLRGIFALVRKIQINIEDFEQDWAEPTMIIEATKLSFPDNGLVLKLAPKELAIYALFMMNEEGISYTEIDKHKESLKKLYGICYRGEALSEIDSVVNSLCEISDSDNLRQTISRCNSKIKRTLGKKMSEFFLIEGLKGKKRRIKCNRDLVTFSDIWSL